MLRPAGIDPNLMREAPGLLMNEGAQRAAVLQAVRQASGLRTTRWAYTDEIQKVLTMRGERSAAAWVPTWLPVLLDEGRVECQESVHGLLWRHAH